MSQTETLLLSDGRKTSDLKVSELKKELEKIGKSKSGNKSELLNRLNESLIESLKSANQIEKENSELPESHIELHNSNQEEIEDNTLNDRRVVNFKPNSVLDVDLDASDENQLDTSEVNQSVDALDLYVPIDDSLNIPEDSIQEERIQVTISRSDNNDDDMKQNEDDNTNDDNTDNDERRVVETIQSDRRTVICNNNDSEKDDIIDMEYMSGDGDKSGKNETRTVQLEEMPESSKKVDNTEIQMENEPDEMENIELEAQIEMYEVDNIDMDSQLEIYEEHKEENLDSSDKKDETIITNIEKDLRENEFLDVGATDETEEGEVVTIPITARLGKRKVKDGSKEYLSPKKSKKKGLKETKGSGYIIEGPERVEPAQKPKNSISEILRIDRLVRPFTLVQLQDMLSLQGSVKEIWLNKIKSVAYVRYENEITANSARETIDGCRWPSINPKLLSCDFVCLKEMEWMKENGDSGATPPANFRQTQQEQQKDSTVKQQNTHKEQGVNQESANKPVNIDNEWKPVEKSKPANRDHQQPSAHHHKSDKTNTDDNKKRERKERDAVPNDNNNNNNNNNINNKRRQQRSPHPHPDHHRRRHESPTKEQQRPPRERVQEKSKENRNQQQQHQQQQHQHQQHQHQQHQHQPAAPPPPAPPVAAAKLLEDIFRKTVTQPAIYWLPVAKDKKEEPIKKVKEAVRVQ